MTEDGLTDRAFDPLPLGDVEPRGWLRRQLRIQAEGVTAPLEEHWPELADNQWHGGARDGWERGPYYADGLVPLAYQLEDPALTARAEAWVEAFLDWREESGWIGPRDPAFGKFGADAWPRFVVLKVLRQYHEATGSEAALEAMLGFCRYMWADGFRETPLQDWARFRWQDFAVTVHWLYERTGEDWLLAVADRAASQGHDWVEHFAGYRRRLAFAHEKPVEPGERSLETHVVNNAMGLKAPAVTYRLSGADADRAATATALDTLDTFHGQATGLFTGDEHLAGRDPTRGTELCAVVEYMYSLEEAVATLGDARLADRLERVAYNALPATFSPDMAAHQYDQQANQVVCNVAQRPWSNGPDANTFGLEPSYGCCTANLHQGWPKLASHAWMSAPDGLAAVAYAPSAVETTVNGRPVRVVADTDYPFEDTVELTVETDATTTFALYLRVPGWCEAASVELPDGETESPTVGQFHRVEREWTGRDTVTLELRAALTAERRYQGGVALSRGPLVFSLPVAADWQQYGGEPPFRDWELFPTEAWNYGLAVDADAPVGNVSRRPPGETPFSPADPPVELAVEGARVEEWTLDGNGAGPLPASPTTGGERETLTLVPYGCTNLRVTEFPLVGDARAG
jgi:hypothetical protein